MSPISSTQLQEEPIIPAIIDQQEHQLMMDTGATHSSVGKTGSGLLLSNSSVKTIGFSGKPQIIPLTQPVPMRIADRTIFVPLLYSAYTPVNLLGGDMLCPLKANIMCTQDGIYVDIPDDLQNKMMPMLSQQSGLLQPMVYWLCFTPQESMLQHQGKMWEPSMKHAGMTSSTSATT